MKVCLLCAIFSYTVLVSDWIISIKNLKVGVQEGNGKRKASDASLVNYV